MTTHNGTRPAPRTVLDAATVLTKALRGLDPTFTRAEVGLRTDLATVHAMHGDPEQARQHHQHAWHIATQIGSTRQKERLRTLAQCIDAGAGAR